MIADIITRLSREAADANLSMLAVGSVGRQDNDERSDIDVVCIYADDSKLLYPEGMSVVDGQICGFRNIPLHYLERRNFNQQEKHAYLNSRILFDPAGIAGSLIGCKCVWEKDERLNLFCDHLVKLSYTLDITDNYKDCWNGSQDLEKAIARQQHILAAQLRLQLIEHSISLALIKDGIFLPPIRVLYSKWTSTQSADAAAILHVAEVHNLPMEQSTAVLKEALSSHVMRVVREFEGVVPLPDHIYSYRIGVTRKYD